MFVNQVLFGYESVAGVFICHIFIKNSHIFHEKVKFWAAKATKIIKILDLFGNADINNIFC